MILVTAAFGNQGQRLIPLLSRAGRDVRAMRASGDLDQLLALGAKEAIHGDASDPQTLKQALEGVDTVYHIGPALHPRERDMGIAVVNAAEEAGVNHLVFSSVLHAIEPALIQHRAKLAIEQRIINSNVNWTILQPTNYLMPAWTIPVFDSGVFRLWWSLDRRQSLIVLDDFAEVAAKVICEGSPHFGATYELSSADCLTGHEIAEIFTSVTGRETFAEEVPADEFLVKYRKHPGVNSIATPGQPISADDFPYEFEVFRAIGKHYGEYDFVGNPNVMRWLLGREPTSVENYLRREFAKMHAITAQ